MEEIKAGDVVQLKSGGPSMTVEAITTENVSQPVATCVWFEGKTLKREKFYIPVIAPYDDGGILY